MQPPIELTVVVASPEAARALAGVRLEAAWEVVWPDDGGEMSPLSEALAAPVPAVAGESRAGRVNRSLSAARGAVVLLLGDDAAPSPSGLAAHWTAHQDAPEVVVCGPTSWSPETTPTSLDGYLCEAGPPLGALRLADGDGVAALDASNVSLRRSLWAAVGGLDERLGPGWDGVELGRRLIAAGARPRFVAGAEAWRRTATSPEQLVARFQQLGSDAAALYEIDPDAVPRVTRQLGLHLRHGGGGGAGSELLWLGRALRGSGVDLRALEHLEHGCFMRAFAARAASDGTSADPDWLPHRYLAALELAREHGPQAAAMALAPLVERSPLVLGSERIQLLLKADNADAAREQAEALVDRGGAWAGPHLAQGEVALAVGDLTAAEAAFDAAYEAAGRTLETAWQIAELFRRWGPAPAARPHLERIVADPADRPARDVQALIGPASARLEELPVPRALDR